VSSGFGLLLPDTVWFCGRISTFRKNILHSSSDLKYVGSKAGLFILESYEKGCRWPHVQGVRKTHFEAVEEMNKKWLV
jgi:hypothetical protein